MPENAAAEGGFGLSAGEAFGGQVGTGNVGASEVGGAFGGGNFGGGEGPGSPAAQAAAASNAVSVAAGIFGNSGVQNGILGMMGLAPGLSPGSPAQSMAPSMYAPDEAQGFNPEAVFGMTAPSMNPSTGGLLAGSPAPDAAPSASMAPSGMFSAPAAPTPAPGPSAMISAPSQFGPPAILSVDKSPTAMPSMDTVPSVSMAPPGYDPIASYGTGTSNMSVNPADIGGDLSGIIGTPATVAPAVSAAPAVSPAMAPSMTSRPQARPEDSRSLLGRLGQDLAMGLSINPFASRETQTQSLIDRGWNPTDVSSFMARSINTDRQNAANIENQVGAGSTYIPDSELMSFGNNLSFDQRQRFMSLDRNGQVQMYLQARGY
jgi:hypothetical protein